MFCYFVLNLWSTYFSTFSLSFVLFGYFCSFDVHYLQNLDAKAPCQNYSYSRQIHGTKQKIMLRASANKVIFRRKHLKYFLLFNLSSVLKLLSILQENLHTWNVFTEGVTLEGTTLGSCGPTSLHKQGHPRKFLTKLVHFS